MAPLLTICTVLIFALVLYWYPTLRVKFYYKKVKTIEQATHVKIIGRTLKNLEIKELFQNDES